MIHTRTRNMYNFLDSFTYGTQSPFLLSFSLYSMQHLTQTQNGFLSSSFVFCFPFILHPRLACLLLFSFGICITFFLYAETFSFFASSASILNRRRSLSLRVCSTMCGRSS